jgi:hypothetical protein
VGLPDLHKHHCVDPRSANDLGDPGPRQFHFSMYQRFFLISHPHAEIQFENAAR